MQNDISEGYVVAILSDIFKEITDRVATGIASGNMSYFSGYHVMLDDRGNEPLELPYVEISPYEGDLVKWNTNNRTMEFSVMCRIFSKKNGNYATKTGGALVDLENFMNDVVSDWQLDNNAMYLEDIEVDYNYETLGQVETELIIKYVSEEFEPGGM